MLENAARSTESAQNVGKVGIDELMGQLTSSPDGLTSSEAQSRLGKFGYNAISEKKTNPVIKFLGYLWGPIPWMIEVAAILSAILRHWTDFGVIVALLLFNAVIGFWQEHQAANAVEALKKRLALKANAKRDGKWSEVEARTLVPGDVIRLRLGDIIPADVRLFQGDYLSVDQSALTGESLPVDKNIGDEAYSGSVAKQGEMVGLVTATGMNTYFGKTARLVSSAKSVSHFQKAVLTIGDYLIYLSLGLSAVLVATMLYRGSHWITLAQFSLILIVAAIPVAMPAVLSVTMAIGAVALAKMKAIVTRLESIEEMAGIQILCSDKTGTLTQNKLSLSTPALFGAANQQELILAAALASEAENRDAIDTAVIGGLKNPDALNGYTQTKFMPFDPVHKRTEAEVNGPDGGSFKVTKGAPQVILELSRPDPQLADAVQAKVDTFARQGFRTLGVARSTDEQTWQFLGLLPLADPPREDSADTIRRAEEHGIQVKMVTGDNTAIAKQIASQLGLGTNIHLADEFFDEDAAKCGISHKLAQQVEAADGFAQVFPEHKFEIVKTLQEQGWIVGMTGDGVNDAPALKQADTGVAVSGATDAARAAADLVLTEPGLSVIVRAVEEARKIFERMNSYAIYRITETIRIMFFVVLAMIVFNFYPITAIMIILLAFFNDLPIMTIAYDNTWLDPRPVRWNMHRILSVSTVLGLVGVLETFGMLFIGKLLLKLDLGQIQSLIFLKLAVAGHLTLFVARTRRPFLTRPYPAAIMLWAAIGTKLLVTVLVAYGFGLVTPLSWQLIGIVWGYCIIWIFIEDLAKMGVYHHLGMQARHHKTFLGTVQQSFTHHESDHRQAGPLRAESGREIKTAVARKPRREIQMPQPPVAQSVVSKVPLRAEELREIDAYWRASLYLCAGMIYLRDNPLLKQALHPEHIKKRLLGHWGSDPGQAFTWVHLNRVIKKYDLNMIYISGPGHGAPATLANAYLEGTYSEVYPDKSQDEEGLRRFFRQFSFPGGIGSHCTPETPGSIHEGGELGYSISHAFGAAFDNPDLIVAVMVGDGEAETGPLATAWHSNKFLNPVRDGAVLPILHLNGYKIANPTVLARISHEQLESLFIGYGYKPHFVEGPDPETMHQLMAQTLETVIAEIRDIQQQARTGGDTRLPEWPMIVLRTPKGWTGPQKVDGHKVEDFWRAHQVPIDVHANPEHLKLLKTWMKSYKPEELFDETGRLIPELRELAPTGHRRLSANPVTNAGKLRKPLRLPDFRDYAVEVPRPGATRVENTRVLGTFLRDVMRNNPTNFRVFGPDETASNRLTAIYEATRKTWMAEIKPEDADGGELSPDGRVMEMLSEHTLEGWLEGYLLSGRHGFFASYEAFIHVIDSMFNQHAKWLEKCKDVSWRVPVSSLNLLVTSTVWRQDHNGFSHQDPGFLDVVTNKSPNVTRIYLPPDANCLLSVADHCLRSINYVNVIVADKQPHLQYLSMDEAILHCTNGIGIWDWASNDQGSEPDVVLACAGDVPTMESLAATAILRENFPDLKVRFINVVDLFKLEPQSEHGHGLSDRDFDSLFTIDKPIIFNFHGYPWLIHKLAYRRTNHKNLHVRGYKEQGNINTPLELAMHNQIDRFNLAIDVIDRVPKIGVSGAHVKEWLRNQIIENTNHAYEQGTDKPEFSEWKWPQPVE